MRCIIFERPRGICGVVPTTSSISLIDDVALNVGFASGSSECQRMASSAEEHNECWPGADEHGLNSPSHNFQITGPICSAGRRAIMESEVATW